MKIITAALGLIACIHSAPIVQAADDIQKPAIVLVHGAFADGSGWNKVIGLLEKQGFAVTAVQNPLTSLADDVATTRRLVEAQTGPVVLVGHSYGGAVITAAAQSSRVKALVYIAAFAPDAGDSLGKLLGSMAPAQSVRHWRPILAAFSTSSATGFMRFSLKMFLKAKRD